MAYCPRCSSEYAEGVRECIECRVRLIPGHKPPGRSIDVDDLLVPVGSFICLLVAAALISVYLAARSGQLPEPLAGLILSSQPPCLIVFYAIGGIVSAAVFSYWLVRRLAGRRD